MNEVEKGYFSRLEKACGPLLHEIQVIWDEIGESYADREKTLHNLEHECVEAHRRILDKASHLRVHLRQSIADAEAELAAICSAMGERPINYTKINQIAGSLKSEISTIGPLLEEMRNRRAERIGQFLEVTEQINKIRIEIGATSCNQSEITFDESELTTRKLEELQIELQSLQKEKSERVKKVMGHLKDFKSLCIVLGLEFQKIIQEVHPSLEKGEEAKNLSDDLVGRLASAIQKWQEVKIQRMKKLQHIATSMLELWDLMDVPIEEQQLFENITRNVAALEHEVTEPKILSIDLLKQAEAEVLRLGKLKASKTRDILLKKKCELEEMRRKTHLLPEDGEINFALEAVEAGAISYSLGMEQIDNQISLVKEEVVNRKDILEKVEKWLNACEEEKWLEEYSKDENRYNAGRGAHLALKRAEKARAVVNKIPAMLQNLSDKVATWERERGKIFTYDGVSLHLMLEKYNVRMMEKVRELEHQKEQKKLYKQMVAEQEIRYGSKPSPVKCLSSRKGRGSIAPHRRLYLGGVMSEPPRTDDRQQNKSTNPAKKITEDRLFFSPGKKAVYCSPPPTKLRYNNSTTPRRPELPRQPFSQIAHPNNIISAPPKLMSDINSTSRTPILMPMQMQVGPTPSHTSVKYRFELINAEGIEYSFEERRLACYLAAQN